MTEITDSTENWTSHEVVFFDGSCSLCRTGSSWLERMLRRHHVAFMPLQSPQACRLTRLPQEELNREMKLRLPDGRVIGGVDVLLHLAEAVWWMRPIAWTARVRIIHRTLGILYRFVAVHRRGLSAAARHSIAWVPLIALIALACVLRPLLPAWIAMVLMTIALLLGLKLLTRWPLRSHAGAKRSLAYLFAWPGLDAKRFLSPARPKKVESDRILFACMNLLCGATLVWLVARFAPASHPLIAGWIGMIGLVKLLHFGLLQLICITWQRAGVDAPLMMAQPVRSTTVADFWSRWNLPFRAFAYTCLLRPLRSLGLGTATMITFVVSGLLHELAISVPAGAGFGGPTIYFVLQGLAILFQRSVALRASWLGRLFTWIVLIAPLPLLFHPPFIERVVLPLMHAIGALGKEMP
jgi:alginate O-acetyltransferase complex protein AlgI